MRDKICQIVHTIAITTIATSTTLIMLRTYGIF
mgnify:FL=1